MAKLIVADLKQPWAMLTDYYLALSPLPIFSQSVCFAACFKHAAINESDAIYSLIQQLDIDRACWGNAPIEKQNEILETLRNDFHFIMLQVSGSIHKWLLADPTLKNYMFHLTGVITNNESSITAIEVAIDD